MFDQNLQESEKFQEVQKIHFLFRSRPCFYIFLFDLLLFFSLFERSNSFVSVTFSFFYRFFLFCFFDVSFFSLDNFFKIFSSFCFISCYFRFLFFFLFLFYTKTIILLVSNNINIYMYTCLNFFCCSL